MPLARGELQLAKQNVDK